MIRTGTFPNMVLKTCVRVAGTFMKSHAYVLSFRDSLSSVFSRAVKVSEYFHSISEEKSPVSAMSAVNDFRLVACRVISLKVRWC